MSTKVFPTHVGVFLKVFMFVPLSFCLPHARGGVSICKRRDNAPAKSSPRTWGCFPEVCTDYPLLTVFPTHVGVFLGKHGDGHADAGLPHARGGVSIQAHCARDDGESSPRTWGCFFGG